MLDFKRRDTNTSSILAAQLGLHAFAVMTIQPTALRKEGGDAAGVVGEVFGFVGGEGAVEEGLLAVA